MAQIVTFDPDALRIIEVNAGGDTVLTWKEIYSEWKDWLLADLPARGGYPAAFSIIGGQERGGGAANIGTTYFLSNRWRFRPAEYSHHVRIDGNIVTDPAGERPWVTTLGAYTVGVQLESSNLVDTLTVGSGVLSSDITAIGSEVEGRILSDGTAFAGAGVDATATLVEEMHGLGGYLAGAAAVMTNLGSGVWSLVSGARRMTITTVGDPADTGTTITHERDDP